MQLVSLDKTDPAIAEAVAGCEVGVPQTFTITMTPLVDDDSKLVAEVNSLEYTEAQEAPADESELEEVVTGGESPYRPRSNAATAVE